MHSLGLLVLVLGFIGLANLLFLLMCCDVVEKQHFNDSDLYWYATELVNKIGGPFRVRIFCCWTGLPSVLYMILIGFILFRLY
ncbi:MAG: hypothetical protein UX89_C0014G0023 [Parcubacteria group bacterium GW2011_GWA2_47_16]|nr:MAG: hypothetical protein UX89_C0014G0023 [Parcubacteria group bacterium GW2011_GWA2_47_16]